MSGSFYYLGLGSNLAPASNFSATIERLLSRFHYAVVLPIIKTEPVAINTDNGFVNSLVIIYSELAPEQLKAWSNNLESELGRDRDDPFSAKKDRPMDIDILAQQSQLDGAILARFTEPYVQEVVAKAKNTPSATATLSCQIFGALLEGTAWLVFNEEADEPLQISQVGLPDALNALATSQLKVSPATVS